MSFKIIISGAPWAGKTSVITEIVNRFNCKTADVWQIFRKRAVEKKLTIAEYDKLIENKPKEDVEMDNDFKKLIESTNENIIVSWRLWFYFMPEIISIYLDVDPKEWANRVFLDDRWKQENKYETLEQALKSNTDRISRLKDRIMKVYSIDFTDKSNYKKTIDTTNKSFEQVVNEVLKYIYSCSISNISFDDRLKANIK